ncbi:alpha/beta hydrolase [Spirochaeta dissipatitropha]
MDLEVLREDGPFGSIVRLPDLTTGLIAERHVDVLLPPSYADPESSGERYPVIYMHDGQNAFFPDLSFAGTSWEIDRALSELGKKAIVVAVWNSGPQRRRDYMPNAALIDEEERQLFVLENGGAPLSDAYLDWLVSALKPTIDSSFRSLSDRDNTFILGSSMGGLISLYALCQYPQIFAAAACISTHWPIGGGCMLEYMHHFLPDPGAHRLYFDHGTLDLDQEYAEYQMQADEILVDRGYRSGEDWVTRIFKGTGHDEQAWQNRVGIPLGFMLKA